MIARRQPSPRNRFTSRVTNQPCPPTLARGFPQAAAFCYEELVLISPSDHVVHCRLGELYYTMGGEWTDCCCCYIDVMTNLTSDRETEGGVEGSRNRRPGSEESR